MTIKLCREHSLGIIEMGVAENLCTLHATANAFPDDWETEIDAIFSDLNDIRERIDAFVLNVKHTLSHADTTIDSP